MSLFRVLAKMRPLLFCALLYLTACAMVGPDYAPPIMEVPTDWSRLEADTGAVEEDPSGEGYSMWWRHLDDPLLSELVAEAMRANPDMRGALAKLRAARARTTVATAAFYPEVTASGSASRTHVSEEGGDSTRELFSAGFDASWEFDVFGGVRRGREAAEADYEASVAELYDVRVTLAAEVALNYVEVRALQIRIGITRDNLASQAETLQLTEWRAQAGLVSIQDVEQARGTMEQTRAGIPSLEISLAEAEHRLDILLGRPPGALHARLAAPGDLPRVPDTIAVGIPADILRRRPDIRAAERTLAAETARVGVAEAARYPSFKLSGSIGLEVLTLAALGTSSTLTSVLLAGVTAPIFDAGRLRAQVEIQDAVREQALISYEQAVRGALQDVENALVALARNRERSEALGNAVEAARNAALLARHRYSSGLIDFQSVLDTERTVLSVEDSLASTRAEGVLALIRLYKAVGGGWTPQSAPGTAGKGTR